MMVPAAPCLSWGDQGGPPPPLGFFLLRMRQAGSRGCFPIQGDEEEMLRPCFTSPSLGHLLWPGKAAASSPCLLLLRLFTLHFFLSPFFHSSSLSHGQAPAPAPEVSGSNMAAGLPPTCPPPLCVREREAAARESSGGWEWGGREGAERGRDASPVAAAAAALAARNAGIREDWGEGVCRTGTPCGLLQDQVAKQSPELPSRWRVRLSVCLCGLSCRPPQQISRRQPEVPSHTNTEEEEGDSLPRNA